MQPDNDPSRGWTHQPYQGHQLPVAPPVPDWNGSPQFPQSASNRVRWQQQQHQQRRDRQQQHRSRGAQPRPYNETEARSGLPPPMMPHGLSLGQPPPYPSVNQTTANQPDFQRMEPRPWNAPRDVGLLPPPLPMSARFGRQVHAGQVVDDTHWSVPANHPSRSIPQWTNEPQQEEHQQEVDPPAHQDMAQPTVGEQTLPSQPAPQQEPDQRRLLAPMAPVLSSTRRVAAGAGPAIPSETSSMAGHAGSDDADVFPPAAHLRFPIAPVVPLIPMGRPPGGQVHVGQHPLRPSSGPTSQTMQPDLSRMQPRPLGPHVSNVAPGPHQRQRGFPWARQGPQRYHRYPQQLPHQQYVDPQHAGYPTMPGMNTGSGAAPLSDGAQPHHPLSGPPQVALGVHGVGPQQQMGLGPHRFRAPPQGQVQAPLAPHAPAGPMYPWEFSQPPPQYESRPPPPYSSGISHPGMQQPNHNQGHSMTSSAPQGPLGPMQMHPWERSHVPQEPQYPMMGDPAGPMPYRPSYMQNRGMVSAGPEPYATPPQPEPTMMMGGLALHGDDDDDAHWDAAGYRALDMVAHGHSMMMPPTLLGQRRWPGRYAPPMALGRPFESDNEGQPHDPPEWVVDLLARQRPAPVSDAEREEIRETLRAVGSWEAGLRGGLGFGGFDGISGGISPWDEEGRWQSDFSSSAPSEVSLDPFTDEWPDAGEEDYDCDGGMAGGAAAAAVGDGDKTGGTNESSNVVVEHLKSEECVVCLAETPGAMVLPCRHTCICHNCARQMRRRCRYAAAKCPLCRTAIRRLVRVEEP